jgi:hypothetical protein
MSFISYFHACYIRLHFRPLLKQASTITKYAKLDINSIITSLYKYWCSQVTHVCNFVLAYYHDWDSGTRGQS